MGNSTGQKTIATYISAMGLNRESGFDGRPNRFRSRHLRDQIAGGLNKANNRQTDNCERTIPDLTLLN